MCILVRYLSCVRQLLIRWPELRSTALAEYLGWEGKGQVDKPGVAVAHASFLIRVQALIA